MKLLNRTSQEREARASVTQKTEDGRLNIDHDLDAALAAVRGRDPFSDNIIPHSASSAALEATTGSADSIADLSQIEEAKPSSKASLSRARCVSVRTRVATRCECVLLRACARAFVA